MKTFTKVDLWLSIALLIGGFWAFGQSRGFDEASGSYPQALSLSIVALAIILFVETVGKDKRLSDSLASLARQMSGGLLVLALFIVWVLLLSAGTGFLASSILALAAVLWLLGPRRIKYITLTTIGIVLSVFVLFYLILDVPLPLHPSVQQFFS